MKRTILIAGLSTMFLFGCDTGQEHFFSPYELSDLEKEKLREGDIILRYGEGFASDLIVDLLNEEREISHCGILVQEEGGPFRVIHSVSSSLSDADGMQEQELDEFVAQSVDSTVMVVRYTGGEDEASSSRIAEKAEHYLEKEYPFDHAFDLKDSSEIYCTELVERVVRDAFQTSVVEGYVDRPYGHLHFDIFWKSDDFKIIIDHHR